MGRWQKLGYFLVCVGGKERDCLGACDCASGGLEMMRRTSVLKEERNDKIREKQVVLFGLEARMNSEDGVRR